MLTPRTSAPREVFADFPTAAGIVRDERKENGLGAGDRRPKSTTASIRERWLAAAGSHIEESS